MFSKDQLRADVAALLGVPGDSIGDSDDLVRLGLHSMLLMKLSGTWRRQGYRVQSSQLALEPTIEAWAALLGAGSAPAESAPSPSPAPAPAESDPADPAAEAEDEEFALATMQHAYWVGRQSGQALGGVAAHLYVEFDGAGADPDRLERAVAQVVSRHDQLRSAFGEAGKQRILAQPPESFFRVVDLREAADADAELETMRDRMSHQLLDVAAGRVVEFVLTLLPEGKHRLHLDVDMLAADAMSYRRILDDLAAAYESDGALPPVGYSFRQYLAERGDRIPADEHEAARRWWTEKLPSLPETAELPTIAEARRADPSRSVRFHHRLEPEDKTRLYALAHGHGLTPAVTLASVFSEVIARWSARQRFLLNLPLFNREPVHDEIDQVVGDFTNSVLVDVDARASESLVARARRLQRELHSCAAHATYEGLDVLRDLGKLRGSAVTPSVVFTSGLGLGELFSERVTRLFGSPVWILSQGPQVDLDAQVAEVGGGLLVNWDTRRDALPAGVMASMFAEFRALLDSLLAPEADWNAPLSIALPAEQRAAREAAETTSASIAPRTLHAEFFERAARHPERVALVTSQGEELTYGAVAEQALSLANSLITAGVNTGDTVAVIVPKGHRQVISVLGVLAAGAVYLPVGTDQPVARRDRILSRGLVRAVVTGADVEVPEGISRIVFEESISGPRADQAVVPDPDALAYVLFTSGSTGEPKGVEVSHRAAANTLDAIAEEFGLTAEDRTIGLSALEFDLSVFDMFSPLALGGALVCIDADKVRDAAAWAELVAAHRISVLNCAPGLIGMLLDAASADQLRSLRVVITGGDRVDAGMAARMRARVPGLRFAGLGGTTETAIHSTVYEVTDEFPAEWTAVPYGRPLSGVRCRVVNERGEDAPDWVTGELWIGGVSVADGYRGDPERTADRFVTAQGTRWYRTGDLARYLPGGTIDFLGRADHQVKIRGYRVELGEVEAAAKTRPEVGEAVAAVVAGRLSLAVVGAEAGRVVDTVAVAAALAELLPEYMVPDVLHFLEQVPLTSNGKIDRAAIRAVLEREAEGRTVAEYVAPETALEAAIAYIAAQVLGIDRIGVTTDFFDAGANSILATTFVANVRGLLAIDGVGVTDVFSAKTVRGFAARLVEREEVPGQLTQVARILLEVAGVPDPSADLAAARA
ncbi:amino acid adenylation domain-containing protein [Nocardia puris]|uniref:non-ribosomal peptide synthetase n=1 Tax=Nocardia puris TaxID=208602 RepID=UPI001894BF45|nr:non-ribosomal peptide synthetase [Nocardia puris]MBF6212360.1 amino acid adenylation domain-containing protein [Nocardia puris]MBF6366607.1 amino acid adenylation domain-containing protein [Nocardia puris]MBF6460949.1 amino acid adenylation domain-containing protein [Nocardia puris]